MLSCCLQHKRIRWGTTDKSRTPSSLYLCCFVRDVNSHQKARICVQIKVIRFTSPGVFGNVSLSVMLKKHSHRIATAFSTNLSLIKYVIEHTWRRVQHMYYTYGVLQMVGAICCGGDEEFVMSDSVSIHTELPSYHDTILYTCWMLKMLF